MKIKGIAELHTLFFDRIRRRWVLKRKGSAGKWVPTLAGPEVTTERLAIAWARALLLAPPARPEPEPPPVDNRTVSDFFKVWEPMIKQRSKLGPDTRERYISAIRSNVLPHLGPKRLAEIDVAAVRGLVRTLRASIAPLYLGHILARLALFFDDAQAEGWLPVGDNPARSKLVHQELPRMQRKSGTVIVVLPFGHAQALIDDSHIPLHWRFRYLVAFGMGLRDGEVAALRRHRFRLDAAIPQVDIHRSASARTRNEQPTKTAAGRRTVPLPPALVEAFTWWFTEGYELAYGRGPLEPEGLLFVARDGRPSRPKSSDRVRRDLERLGLPTTCEGFPITFHAARRSYGSWLRAAGVDVPTIVNLIGHEGETLAEQAYVAPSLETMARAVVHMPLRWRAPLVPVLVQPGPRGGPNSFKGEGDSSPGSSKPQFGHELEAIGGGPKRGGHLPDSLALSREAILRPIANIRRPVVLGTMGTTTAPSVSRADWLPDAPPSPTPSAIAVLRRGLRRAG